jgi:hypothetical protein
LDEFQANLLAKLEFFQNLTNLKRLFYVSLKFVYTIKSLVDPRDIFQWLKERSPQKSLSAHSRHVEQISDAFLRRRSVEIGNNIKVLDRGWVYNHKLINIMEFDQKRSSIKLDFLRLLDVSQKRIECSKANVKLIKI